MTLHHLVIADIVRRALHEDLGQGYDITTDSLIPADHRGKAVMRTRQDGVLAGLEAAFAAFHMLDKTLKITAHAKDGENLAAGQDILSVEGLSRSILTGERTALNFMTHLSGIATQTRAYVEAVKGTKARITCTRKTLPGLRTLQKYAIRRGGGQNHRFGLGDAVLIKDNHIALAGGIDIALEAARKNAGHMLKIELEVDTLEQLEDALQYKFDVVLLDNMAPDMLRQAVTLVDGRILTEASGGVTLDTVRAIAETGVDMISVGALTHSVTALDIGLDVS